MHRWPRLRLALFSLGILAGLSGSADALADCAVAPAKEWRDQEKWIWERICAGEIADLVEFASGPMSPGEVANWPDTRDLSAPFLRRILTDPAYVNATPAFGVHILDAHVREPLDFRNITLSREIAITDSVFDDVVNLTAAQSSESISFAGSWFRIVTPPKAGAPWPDPLLLSGISVAKVLNLNRSVTGSLTMLDARIGFDLLMNGSTIHGNLNLSSAHIAGAAQFDQIITDGNLTMANAEIGGDVYVGDAIIGDKIGKDGGTLAANNLNLGGGFYLGYSEDQVKMPGDQLPAIAAELWTGPGNGRSGVTPAEIAATKTDPQGPDAKHDDRVLPKGTDFRAAVVNLNGAVIGGECSLRQVAIAGVVFLEDARIKRDLWLTSGRFGIVDLSGIDGQGFLMLQNSEFTQVLKADNAHIGKSIVMSPQTTFRQKVNLSGSTVDGDVYFAGATVEGEADLHAINIARDLKLNDGTTFRQALNANFIHVGGNLDMSKGSFASVDLTGSEIKAELRLATQDSAAAFQDKAKLSLRNVAANSLRDLPTSWPNLVDLEGFTYLRIGGSASDKAISERSAADLENWLERQKPFTPQPYTQLAGVLKDSGDADKARSILFAGKNREWATAGFLEKIGLGLHFIFTGYGLHPEVAFLWIGLLVGVGAYVVGRDRAPEVQRMTRPERVIYSLDMLLPVVHLRHGHYEFDLAGRARYYFYAHKIMGYVLASFLIASYTGGGAE